MPKSKQFLKNHAVFPHEKYGIDTSNIPDYVEPFIAYRAWSWNENGITSLNNAPWTPKVAFEATCNRNTITPQHKILSKELEWIEGHPVPNEDCTCGMYAGINMKHMLEHTSYMNHGIHGEVELWGRLYRHTMGWRAQYAYPKNFIIPPDMIPWSMTNIEERLKTLVAYDVDIHLQVEKNARMGGPTIPLWIKGFGWSQQGVSHLISLRKKWYEGHMKIPPLAVGSRIAILNEGFGIVEFIDAEYAYYSLFGRIHYRTPLNEVQWNNKNCWWECSNKGWEAFGRRFAGSVCWKNQITRL